MPTIKDVANRAGVAPITASRVINDSGYVSETTRQRVEVAIEELGYVPNRIARSLRSKETYTLALVLSDIANPFWPIVARGVEDVANEDGFSVILGNTDESEAKEYDYVRVLLQKQVDGFILVPTRSDTRSIALIRKQKVPLVVVDRSVWAPVDTGAIGLSPWPRRPTCHLLEAGHTRIAMLSGPREVSTAVDRVAGYRRALTEAGIPVDERMVIYGTFTQPGGYEMTQQVLALTPRPTAYFAANNFIAIGLFPQGTPRRGVASAGRRGFGRL